MCCFAEIKGYVLVFYLSVPFLLVIKSTGRLLVWSKVAFCLSIFRQNFLPHQVKWLPFSQPWKLLTVLFSFLFVTELHKCKYIMLILDFNYSLKVVIIIIASKSFPVLYIPRPLVCSQFSCTLPWEKIVFPFRLMACLFV